MVMCYWLDVYLSVIDGIKKTTFIGCMELVNTRLQLSDTSPIPPMHDGFLLSSRNELMARIDTDYHCQFSHQHFSIYGGINNTYTNV